MSTVLRASALALFLGLLAAAPASAGQIVFNAGDTIYAANDDGSGQRALITPADVPGAVSVYYPFVSPNSDTVVFSARTPYAGYGGLYCGFSCVGVYRWDNGAITRLSYGVSACPPGDLCAGLDVDPKITPDGSRYVFQRIYTEPGGSYGAPQSIRNNYTAPAVFEGVRNEVELKDATCGSSEWVPNPANPDQHAYVGCDPNNGHNSAIEVEQPGGGGAVLASDDNEISELAWSPDGSRIADSEGGGDPGIWTVAPDPGNVNPVHVLGLAFDNDHSSYDTSPAFVGNDRIAFLYGGEVRSVPAGCQGCSLGDTTKLADAPDAKGLSWTSRTLPVVQRGGSGPGASNGGSGPGGNPSNGGNGNNGGSGGSGGPGTATLAPRKLKLATALKGLTVPFKAGGAGTLSLKAQLDAKTAKKLKLIKKGTKPVAVASGKASPKAAGDGTVKLKFTKAAAKRLKKAKSLKLKLVGTFTPAGGGAAQNVSATVTLTR
jgi:hypothetical protein